MAKKLADTRALYTRRGQNPKKDAASQRHKRGHSFRKPFASALRAYVRLLQQQKYRNAPKHEVKEAAFTPGKSNG